MISHHHMHRWLFPSPGLYNVPSLPADHEDLEYLGCQFLLHPAKINITQLLRQDKLFLLYRSRNGINGGIMGKKLDFFIVGTFTFSPF